MVRDGARLLIDDEHSRAPGEEPAVPERAEGTGAVDQHRGAPSPLETLYALAGNTKSPIDANPGASSAELTHERQNGPNRTLARDRRPSTFGEPTGLEAAQHLLDWLAAISRWRSNHGCALPASRSSVGPMVATVCDLARSGVAAACKIVRVADDPIALPCRRRVRSRPFPSEPPTWLATKST
jgi:hypothetical protein